MAQSQERGGDVQGKSCQQVVHGQIAGTAYEHTLAERQKLPDDFDQSERFSGLRGRRQPQPNSVLLQLTPGGP